MTEKIKVLAMPTINCRGHEDGCRESKHLYNYQRDIQDMIYAKEQGQNPTLRPSLLNYTCKADSGCADGGLGQNKQTNKRTRRYAVEGNQRDDQDITYPKE